MMEIKVLGRLQVTAGGRSALPEEPEARRVLALLALRADQVVPTCLIAQELWPNGSPPGGDSRLVALIASIRRKLTEALQVSHSRGSARTTGADLLVSTPAGYRLDNCGGLLDARQFERHIGAGYRAMATGNAVKAAERLRLALSLWAGDALCDLTQGTALRAHTTSLHDDRMAALDQWAAIELQLGRHRERLVELGELVDQYRTHQGLHRHYMTALVRCGRSADALRVYDRLCSTLHREGGAEVSPILRRLCDRILNTSVGLGGAVPEFSGSPLTCAG
ncbi:AfsR/SARP family transcriptional regulator [Streptomyces sp. NPDC046924]|uniref:AfsR/SARP family transcriptional regulator n=1 Tax=Streptomyces sp. NPDC046924 TaxID=3155136 RepID=UPI00340C61BE